MDISAWLRGLGLERYEQAFRENAIDEAILPKLTAEDLGDLGVTAVGHRRILLDDAAAQRELMAQHCAVAGLVEKAIEYWDTAGRLAVQRSTMAEAVAHFGKAINLLASLPKSPERRSSELSLQLLLAGALTAAKGWASPEAGEAYARARGCAVRPRRGPSL
jgi:hypothetical protein